MNARAHIDRLFETTRYYHGTGTRATGEAILASGVLRPPNIEDLNKRYGQSFQRPVESSVYLSTSLRYAVIYSLEGVMMGHQVTLRPRAIQEPIGYLFVADGDVETVADEDTLGAIPQYLKKPEEWLKYVEDENKPLVQAFLDDPRFRDSVERLFRQLIPSHTYAQAEEGLAIWQSRAGKMVLKKHPAWAADILKRLFALIANVSTTKEVPWTEAWTVQKKDSHLIEPDCSNFFEVATRIA